MRRQRTTPPMPIPNRADSSGATVLLPLTRDQFAIIDADDAQQLSGVFWCAHFISGRWYASGRIMGEGGWSRLVLMHRYIMNAKHGELIDHKDGNALHNSKSNLRVATKSQNAANSRLRSDNKIGYRGVSWDRSREKWRAYCRPHGKQIHIGYFDDPKDAAHAYDLCAITQFGRFARTNYDLGLIDIPPESSLET